MNATIAQMPVVRRSTIDATYTRRSIKIKALHSPWHQPNTRKGICHRGSRTCHGFGSKDAHARATMRVRTNAQVDIKSNAETRVQTGNGVVYVEQSQPTALPPPAVFKAATNMAVTKAGYPWDKTLILGFLGGALIGIGALLCSAVGAANPALAASNPGLAAFVKGAIGLPAGLSMVILTGAELFTGNVFIMLSGVLANKVRVLDLVKNWSLSFAGNFIGSVFLAYLSFMAKATASASLVASVTKLATTKVTIDGITLFARGIMCNWLVCLAIWMAMAANTISGKILCVLLPISTFVALGFEHSIANMFFVPQGMLAGAEISVQQFLWGNLFPVTVGNIIGAGLFVAFAYYYAYGRNTS